ncbi:hypothetical protein LAZ67_1007371 [Cordylochernes scorpioides]|uniref:Uncharacterized protein n=1 Tax=Cordylochernes scorpioides TaxID=51811 RepID=A0ABY6K126_9ARAC|nr:hypothetical protein LAZ67_1007371 [Cordylochernes scorpioides]
MTSALVERCIRRMALAAPQFTLSPFFRKCRTLSILQYRPEALYIGRQRSSLMVPIYPKAQTPTFAILSGRATLTAEWSSVVFLDEYRFCFSNDSHRGTIAYDNRSPLIHIEDTMTAQRYMDDVLRWYQCHFLQDNARPQTARISQHALHETSLLPPCPPVSPDLSPIEHVWGLIGRRFRALPQLYSEDELGLMVDRELAAIPQDTILIKLKRVAIDYAPKMATNVHKLPALDRDEYRMLPVHCKGRKASHGTHIGIQG